MRIKEQYHIQDESYFYSETHKNLEETDIKEDFQASHNKKALIGTILPSSTMVNFDNPTRI